MKESVAHVHQPRQGIAQLKSDRIGDDSDPSRVLSDRKDQRVI